MTQQRTQHPIGSELVCRPEYAQTVIEVSRSFGIDAQVVGRVEAYTGKRVTSQVHLSTGKLVSHL